MMYSPKSFLNYSQLDQSYYRASPRNRISRALMFNLCLRLKKKQIVRVAKIIFAKDGSLYVDIPGYHKVGGVTAVVDDSFWKQHDNASGFFDTFNCASKVSSITPKYSHHPRGHASFSKDNYISQPNISAPNLITKNGPRQILWFHFARLDRFKTYTPKSSSSDKNIYFDFNIEKNNFIGGMFRFMWSDYHSLKNNILFDRINNKPVGLFGLPLGFGPFEAKNNHDHFYICNLVSPPYGFDNRHYALIIGYESQTILTTEGLERYFCQDSILMQGGMTPMKSEYLVGVYPHPDFETLIQTNESIDYQAPEVLEKNDPPRDPHHQPHIISSDLLRQAKYESLKKKDSEAELTYCDVIRLDPNNSYAWQQLGHFYSNTHRTKKALEAYQKALSIDLTNNYDEGQAANHGNIGHVLLSLHDFENAKSALKQSMELYQILETSSDNDISLWQRCRTGISVSTSNLGKTYAELAKHYYKLHLEEAQKGYDTITMQCNLDQSIDAFVDSIKQYESALNLDTQIIESGLDERKLGLAAVHLNIGSVHLEMYKYRIYINVDGTEYLPEYYSSKISAHYKSALTIYREFKDRPTYKPTSEAGCLAGLGILNALNDNSSLERMFLIQALRHCRQYKLINKYARMYLYLAIFYSKQDRTVIKNKHKLNNYLQIAMHYATLTNNQVDIDCVNQITNFSDQ